MFECQLTVFVNNMFKDLVKLTLIGISSHSIGLLSNHLVKNVTQVEPSQHPFST